MFEERLGSFRGKGSFHEIINEEFFFSNEQTFEQDTLNNARLLRCSIRSIPLKTRIIGHERGKKKEISLVP